VTASPLAFFKVFPAPRVKVARSPVTDTGLAAP
jgi:hypothetical protein